MKPLQFSIVKELVGEDAPPIALGDDYIVSDGVGGSGGTTITFKKDRKTVLSLLRSLLAGMQIEEEKKETPEAPKPTEDPALEKPLTEEAQEGESISEEAKPLIKEEVAENADAVEEKEASEPEQEPKKEEEAAPALSDDPELADYLQRIIAEIFDAPEGQDVITRTAAFMGSRIVTLRYAFALRHDLKTKARFESRGEDFFSQAHLAEISDFITAGIKALIDNPDFDCPAPANAMQQYYPATLASVSVREEPDGRYFLDVISAGDSRVYAYSKHGLKQLSLDDEDETGSMNNYFRYLPEKKTRLNRRCYRFPGPVMVFACSDGCFDPFSHHEAIGICRSFFDKEKALPESMDEWAKQIIDRYLNGFQGDDISIALGLYGGSMEDIFDAYFFNHAEKVNRAFDAFREQETVLDILIEGGEVEKDTYIEKRVPTIYKMRLLPFLGQCARGEVSDIAFSQEIKDYIEASIPKSRDLTPEEVRAIELEALKAAALRDDPHFDIKNTPEGKPLIPLYEDMLYCAADIKRGKAKISDYLAAFETFAKALDGITDLETVFPGKLLRDLNHSGNKVSISPAEASAMVAPFLASHEKEIAPMIVRALEAHPDQSSAIDPYFNPGLLEKCRLNLLIRNGQYSQELVAIVEEVKDFESSVLSLLQE